MSDLKSITAEEIFEQGKSVVEIENVNPKISPYTHIAYTKNLENYRYITYGDILSLRGKDLPEALIKFMSGCNEAVVIANKIKGKIVNVYFRSIKEKKFYYFGDLSVLPYGIGMLTSDFRYGDPLILVEGILDRDSLIEIYPNVVAVLSAGMSIVQLTIMLKITNKFFLLYDNDSPGISANFRDEKRLKELGADVKILKHMSDCKDTGEIIKSQYNCDDYKYELLREYYKTMIKSEIEIC